MNNFTWFYLEVLIVLELACFLAVWLGWRFGPGFDWSRKLAQQTYERKIQAMEKPPLKQYKQAVDNGNLLLGASILTVLIALKILASIIMGVIMTVWLPLATLLLVPGIIDSHDKVKAARARATFARVTIVQVSSHAVGAALGLVITWLAWGPEESISNLLNMHSVIILWVVVVSMLLAALAGWMEARAHMENDLL